MKKRERALLVMAVMLAVAVPPVLAGGGGWEEWADEAHIVVVPPANMAGTRARSVGWPAHRNLVFGPSGGFLPPDGETILSGVVCFTPNSFGVSPCVDTRNGESGVMGPNGVIWGP